MKTEDLDYTLPEALIAQHPAEQRDASRLLVVDRASGTWREDVFRNVGTYLESGDTIAVNDTKVIRARLLGHKLSGGKVEIFLLRETAPGIWEALVKPSARVKPGTEVDLGGGFLARVEGVLEGGRREVRFDVPEVIARLESAGHIPLPPYITRGEEDGLDATRYQTVYARAAGAVAAPTAGLHFTPAVLDALAAKGIRRATLTLHVGYGTFKPIQTETLEEHAVDPEWFDLPESTAGLLNQTRAGGTRVCAVGTTTTRVLETQYRDGRYWPGHGETDRYIYPPCAFHGVDVLQTNFHLPRSSLLALVCAFGGTELIMDAYRYAVEREFRFYSYGDAMLIV